MEPVDPNWKWLSEHLNNLTGTKANSVTNNIMMHLAGRAPSALVGQLLRVIHKLTVDLNRAKEDCRCVKEAHEEEKENLLRLMYTVTKQSEASSAPPDASPTTLSVSSSTTPHIQSSTNPTTQSTTPSTHSVAAGLTVAAPNIRDKSPKRLLQYMVANEVEKLQFKEPWHPSKTSYPNVSEFRAIIEIGEPFGGGYVCTNCDTVVMSSQDKHNQRSFACHLKKCSAFIEKNNGGINDGGTKSDGHDGSIVESEVVPNYSSQALNLNGFPPVGKESKSDL